MTLFFNIFTTFGAISLILLSAFIVIAFYSNSQDKNVIKFKELVKKHSVMLIFLASFSAVLGSLIYSEVFRFEPCVLCWWQRIFIYPVFVISLVALWKKDKNPFQYINPLMIIALLFSLYHNYLIIVAGKKDAFLCDPNLAGSCSDRYVEILSVIDIPFMALSIIIFTLVVSIVSLKNLK